MKWNVKRKDSSNMKSGLEMLCDMRTNINQYDHKERECIFNEWLDLISKGIAKATVINNKYVPYLQYESGETYFSN